MCALGRCRNACRSSRDCPAGTHCLVEPATGLSACSLDQVDGCDASGCPDGFACRQHQCVNLCGAIVRCPDGVCQDSICLPPPDDAGVPTSDAGSCHGPHCDPVIDLALDGDRALVVTTSGEVWGWGDATGGALGDRLEMHMACATCSSTPVRALGPDGTPWVDAVAIAIGGPSCVVRRDGTVWCWGSNYDHQLGNGMTVDTDVPVQVLAVDDAGVQAPLDQVIAIDNDGDQSCVIRGPARDVWCWGGNEEGALGDGTTMPRATAVRASELGTGITEIDVMARRTVSLDSSGTLRGVGINTCQMLGVTATDPMVSGTTLPMAGVAEVTSSIFDTCAIGMDGSLRCWGFGAQVTGHAMGLPACAGCGSGDDPCTPVPQPILQPRNHPLVHLFGHGYGAILGVDADGGLWAWGGMFDEPFSPSADPVQIYPSGVADAYMNHAACMRTSAGDVLCFGANDVGQLGRGTTSASEADIALVVWP